MFRLFILMSSLAIAGPAFGCVIYPDAPSDNDLKTLRNFDKQITNENNLKTSIDMSVWGVFLDYPAQGIFKNGYARFKVGGVFKGRADSIIRVVSNRRNVTIDTQVYSLNLREIDAQRWTDIGVSQKNLNWDQEACLTSPNSQKCQAHIAKQAPFKKLCEAFIVEVNIGCFQRQSLPKNCLQYEVSLLEN